MATRNVFRVTDVSKLYDLGFAKTPYDNDYLHYSTKNKYRIWVYLKKDNIISFIHYNFDALNMFKTLCEMGLIEVKVIDTYTKENKIEQLEQRIAELESRLSLNET